MKAEAIKHGKSRIAAFKKRKTNLLKKAREFTILCGVQLRCIIYGPRLKDMHSTPEIWASEDDELINIINRYKEAVGRDIRAQRASSSSFHENSVEEVDEETAKMGRIEGSKKSFTSDPRFDDFSEDQLGFILSKVVKKLNAPKKKLKTMSKGENVVRENGCMQNYLKNDKVKAHINKPPPCNKNTGTSLHIGVPENMVINNSNPQMESLPRLTNDEWNIF